MPEPAAAPPQHALTDTLQRARRVAASFRAASRVLGVLNQLLPGDAELFRLAGVRKDLEERFTRLTMIDRAQRAFEEALERIENAVLAFGRELAVAEAEIPMDWFRVQLDRTIVTSEALADYAALLGTHAGDDSARLERVQFLLTRVIRQYLGGTASVGGRLQGLLEEVLEPGTIAPEQRTAAVQFFRDAARRTSEFDTLHKMMTSGFFVDTRGYKLSLRRNILDPEVMAAVIEFNDVTSTTIDCLKHLEARVAEAAPGMAEFESPAAAEMKRHLAEVDERLDGVFKTLRSEDEGRAVRFQRRLKKNAAALAKGGAQFRPGQGKPTRWSKGRPYALAAAIVVGLVVIYGQQGSVGGLAELSTRDAHAISPLLARAGLAPRAKPVVLVAEVDKIRWTLMNADERREAAEKLAEALGARGLASGTVMLEGRVVIQIDQGQLLVVQ